MLRLMRLTVFDIDGTLTDTTRVDTACFVAAFDELFAIRDIDTDWASYRYSTDSGIASDILTRHLGEATPENLGRIRERFVEKLSRHMDSHGLEPVPGAPRAFDRLRHDDQTAVAVATGAWSESARLKLRHTGIDAEGVPFASSDDALSRAHVIRAAIRRASESGDAFRRIVYVGDEVWDVRAAARLNLPFVGVGTGDRGGRLRAHGASHVVPDYEDPAAFRAALDEATPPRPPTIRVFIENEAGSDTKNIHDEKTLRHEKSVRVSRPYPYPYGFILNSTAADGGNLDCFVVTDRTLHTGDIVECEAEGLMEQIEDGEEDHNVLAVLPGEEMVVDDQLRSKLGDFVHHVFDHVEGKRIQAGRFLGRSDAERWVALHWDC